MENFTETTESSREKHQTPMLADEVYNEASSGEHDETIDESTLVKLHQEVRTSRLRIVVLTVFAGLNFVTQVQYVTFSTIVRETQGFYHISALTVNVLCLIIPLVFAIGAYPGCLVYNKIGLWNGFLLGFSVNSFAGLLKFISVVKPHVAFLVVAQVCVGIGQLFSLGLASLVSSVWFPVHERSLATSFGALFGFVGMAVGMFYSPFMVDTADDVAGWVTLWVTQFGFSGLFLAFHGFSKLFIPERPKYPPALTATTELDTVPLPTVFKAVLKNKKFIYVTLVFGVISGFLTAVAAMLIQLLEPFGIPETTSGILAFSGITGGSFFCIVLGLVNDRLHTYKKTFIILGCIIVVLLALTTAFASEPLSQHFPIASYILIPLLECAVIPMVPNAVEFAAEITYPAPEHVSGTLILVSMCVFSIIGMIVFSIVLGDHPGKEQTFGIALALTITCLICTILFFFLDNDLRRQKLEAENANKHQTPCDTSETNDVAES